LATQARFDQVGAGERVVMMPETVIADAVVVRGSKRLYGIERERVAALLSHLVRLPGFPCPQPRRRLTRAGHIRDKSR